MVPILTLLLCFSQLALLTYGYPTFKQLPLPSTGSESYAFDPDNGGPYTALNDGRIVKYDPVKNAFVDFATTTKNRSKELCDGTDGSNVTLRSTCGRPLALEFNRVTRQLYIIDAYNGLFVVGMNGGLATPLTPNTKFYFGDGIDIDQFTGIVYLTDLGDILDRLSNQTAILLSNDRGGTLLRYDPWKKQIDVILRGLAVPAGVAVGGDGSFLLITEYITSSVTKFWLKGPKANTTEHLVELSGNVDNIKRTKSGDFWVAVIIQRVLPKFTSFPIGQKISASGEILETINFFGEYNATPVAEVQEYGGSILVSSLVKDFVGVYKGLGF